MKKGYKKQAVTILSCLAVNLKGSEYSVSGNLCGIRNEQHGFRCVPGTLPCTVQMPRRLRSAGPPSPSCTSPCADIRRSSPPCTLTSENNIAGVNAIGGIAGGSMQSVWNCSVDGTTIHVLGDNDFSSGRIIQQDVGECGGLIIGGSFGGTLDNCTAKGTVIAEGNEPVGLGGIAGCLEMMDSVTNCTVEVEIISEQGGHAIGGLCGFSGTHSNGNIVADTEGIVTTEYPGIIDNCAVTVRMNVPGATHVGGLVGTGLYYYGEETAFRITNCTVNGEIVGAITPGAVAGRAANSIIESCTATVTLDGEALTAEVGETATMYESSDQLEEETSSEDNAA